MTDQTKADLLHAAKVVAWNVAVPAHYFRSKQEPKPKTFTFRRYERLGDSKPKAERIESKTVMAGASLPTCRSVNATTAWLVAVCAATL